MARALRILFEGAWYHVMNRGIAHKRIFFNIDHKKKFLELLGEISRIYGVEVHAYCLMDNHYHLVIHTPRGNLSEAIKYLNSKFVQFVNLTLNKDGPLFKGRFKAIIISAEEYLIRLSRYIHLNPVSANITKWAEDYEWSSYSMYLGKKEPTPWLVTREIIKRFGTIEFQKSYKKYVETQKDDELEKFYNQPKFNPVLGDDEYRDFIFDSIKARSLSAEIVGADNILVPPEIITILQKVANYFDTDIQELKNYSPGIKNPARCIAIYICRELGGYKLSEIAEVMGNVSIKTISNTITRTKIDLVIMGNIKHLLMEIKKDMKTISQKKMQGREWRDTTPPPKSKF